MKGRVAALVGPKQVEIQEYPLPKVGAGAVLTRVLRSNLCGSELHIWRWTHPLIKRAVLGHEMVAEIFELGDGVETDRTGTPVKPGDRIVAPYYITCGRCAPCSRGELALCQNVYRWWSQPPEKEPHFTGTFATHYYVQPNQYFFKVPDDLPSAVVAGANCGLSQVICGLEKASLTSGQRLVIQGAGGLGLYATAVAKEKGATVIVLDAVEERLALATEFGADQVLRVDALTETDLVNRVRELTDGEGADVVLEVAGVPQAFPQGVAMSRNGGTYLSIGNVSVDKEFEVPLAPGILTRKSLRVFGVVRYEPVYLLKAVRFLQRTHRRVAYEKLTPTEFGLDAVQEALEKAEARAVIRPVIVPSK